MLARVVFASAALLPCARGGAQVESPQTVAAARATVADAEAWGAAENPAARPVGRFAVSAYGHHALELPDLGRVGLDLGWARGASHFALGVQAFTPPGYSAFAVHLGAGRMLTPGLEAGLRLGLVRRDVGEYGREVQPTAQVGIQYRAGRRLVAGAHYSYASAPVLPLSEHRLRVGIDYTSSRRVHILLAIWQAVDAGLTGGVSLRYDAAERLRFRVGAQGGGTAFTLGVEGELAGGLRLAISTAIYQQLPPGASAGVMWVRAPTALVD